MAGQQISRYGFIDAVRGIAACLVLFQHALYASGLLHGRDDGIIPGWIELGETGVVAFFLVSGFVIPLSLEKSANLNIFWTNRAFRIYPLYFFVYVVTLIITASGPLNSMIEAVFNFLSHVLFVQEFVKQHNFVGGSWTLSLEAVWYILFSLAFLSGVNKRTGLMVALAVAGSIAGELMCHFVARVPMGRLSMLVACVLGLVCFRHHKGELSDRRFWALAAILMVTICCNLIVGFWLDPSPKSPSLRTVSISWSVAGLIFIIPYLTRSRALWDHSFFSFIGRISYSVYLMHAVIIILSHQLAISGIATMIVVPVSTLLISMLTYKYIEAPGIKFGHALGGLRWKGKPAINRAL